jgi:hypothetical protein
MSPRGDLGITHRHGFISVTSLGLEHESHANPWNSSSSLVNDLGIVMVISFQFYRRIYLSISQPRIYFPLRFYISPHSTTLTINLGLHHQPSPDGIFDVTIERRGWLEWALNFALCLRSQIDLTLDLRSRLWTYRLLAPVGTFSIFLTTNIPSTTLPNTQCLPSRNSAGAHVMKNYL